MNEIEWVVTPCSGGDCLAVAAIGADWFRMHSTVVPSINIAVTGTELRAFIVAAKAGHFDQVAALPGDAA